ncbi:unnamed protein product [Effrenium voratum]|uniref:Uncharacterized protein n=1 Tax=Effrenium voratum TaxID=2562239 RepID=A0AA36MLZ8_9DINO|nr:unnamed protein product [Effrenium voratum]
MDGADETLSDGEVVSSNVLEIRLLERIMRECYVEEQRCEEELGILGQLLAKELTEPQELKSALKNEAPEEVPEEVPEIAAPSMGLEDLARIALSWSTRRAA